MLPDYTKINPILKVFVPEFLPSSMVAGLLILFLTFGLIAIGFLNRDLNRMEKCRYTNYLPKKSYWEIYWFITLMVASYFLIVFYSDVIHKNINQIPLKTVFSSYRISKISQLKESNSTIIYDESEEPKVLFKVYLKQIKAVGAMPLNNDVILDVSKVNKDSFEIVLPNEDEEDKKVETIKKEEAPEVYQKILKYKKEIELKNEREN